MDRRVNRSEVDFRVVMIGQDLDRPTLNAALRNVCTLIWGDSCAPRASHAASGSVAARDGFGFGHVSTRLCVPVERTSGTVVHMGSRIRPNLRRRLLCRCRAYTN
jgi:hypothetical protein